MTPQLTAKGSVAILSTQFSPTAATRGKAGRSWSRFATPCLKRPLSPKAAILTGENHLKRMAANGHERKSDYLANGRPRLSFSYSGTKRERLLGAAKKRVNRDNAGLGWGLISGSGQWLPHRSNLVIHGSGFCRISRAIRDQAHHAEPFFDVVRVLR